MRAVGNVVAGPVVAGPGPSLPTGRPDVDRDAMRERREAERARRAAANPFARQSGMPRSKSEAREVGALLVNPEYEAAAFTTPAPADPTPEPTKEVQPVPTPKPTPRPKPAPPSPPVVDAAAIVRDHVDDGLDGPTIARNRGLSVAEVHRILEATPGASATELVAPPAAPAPARARAEERAARNRQIVELYTGPEQLTQTQIAERLGTSAGTVSRTLTAAGVEPRHTGRPKAPSAIADEVAARPDATPVQLHVAREQTSPPKAIEPVEPARATVLYTADLDEAREALVDHAGDLTPDDVDDLVSVLHDADIARTVAHSIGADTPVLDANVRRATALLDAAVRHELETIHLLQEARR